MASKWPNDRSESWSKVFPVVIYYALSEYLFGDPSKENLLHHAKLSTEYYWVYITGSMLVFSQGLKIQNSFSRWQKPMKPFKINRWTSYKVWSATILCLLTTERFSALVFPFWHRQMSNRTFPYAILISVTYALGRAPSILPKVPD